MTTLAEYACAFMLTSVHEIVWDVTEMLTHIVLDPMGHPVKTPTECGYSLMSAPEREYVRDVKEMLAYDVLEATAEMDVVPDMITHDAVIAAWAS